MSTDITALVVALVGVTGTLTVSVVTQRLSMQARRQELDAERWHRSDERDAEQRRAELAERKTAYLELLVAERSYRRALKNQLLAPSDQTLGEVEQARRAFDRTYVEAHLTATEPVLKAVVKLGTAFFNASGAIAELDSRADADTGVRHERATLLHSLEVAGEVGVRGRVLEVRAVMKSELTAERDRLRRSGPPPDTRRATVWLRRWRTRDRPRG